MDFVPQSQHPSHIIPNYMCHPERKMSSQTLNVIPNAKCHPERCASSYALASKNASGSHHSSTKPLIPGFPIRSSSSSSQAPPAVDCSAGPPIAPTLKSFTRVENTKKNCIKHQNKIKELLPKTENQFSSCVLSQEEVDLKEYYVCAKI